ncbi:MAG: RNA polymerase sigma factor [Desulfatibacillum sp.]|nr:RNA polymerase sigma factor [Desulfatibacillum sp.]
MEFDTFYIEYRGKVFGYLLRMTGDRDLSLDLAQESFTRCLERYSKVPNPVPLVFTIARNLVYDNHRWQSKWDAREAPEQQDESNPEKMLLEREKGQHIALSMQRLPDNEREILALVVTRTLSYKEIAGITGISEANVKVRVHRARKNLRQFLEDKQ